MAAANTLRDTASQGGPSHFASKNIEEGQSFQRSLEGHQCVQSRAQHDEAQSWRILERGEATDHSHVLVETDGHNRDDHHHALDD